LHVFKIYFRVFPNIQDKYSIELNNKSHVSSPPVP
jgi:hypothetical protein